jgi:uncharacterized protein YqgV (UPF0045/DUF77 family)
MALTQRKKRPIDRSSKVLGDTRLLIIATEGRITEKQYFAQFRNRRVQVKVIPTGEDNKSSPEYVLERLKHFRQEYALEANDELWLMIDVDRWKDKKLSLVTKEAKKSGFKLAFQILVLKRGYFAIIVCLPSQQPLANKSLLGWKMN